MVKKAMNSGREIEEIDFDDPFEENPHIAPVEPAVPVMPERELEPA